MKVNYYLNSDGTVSSFNAIPFDASKPYVEISSASDIMIGVTKISSGAIDSSGVQAAETANKEKSGLHDELEELYRWFRYYDYQVSEYLRHTRLGSASDVDIAALDSEAATKAARINEIRALLA